MSKKFILFILFIHSSHIYAQWTEKDSTWLQNMLSGKDSIRLNPETMKAIQQGNFLNTETPHTPMLNSPHELPVLKDFSEYIQPEEHRKVPLKDLPPPILQRHSIEYEKDTTLQISEDLLNFPIPPATTGVDLVHGLNYIFSKEYRQHYKNKKKAEKLKFYHETSSDDVKRRQQFVNRQREELPLPSVTRRDSTQKDSVKPDIPSLNLQFKKEYPRLH